MATVVNPFSLNTFNDTATIYELIPGRGNEDTVTEVLSGVKSRFRQETKQKLGSNKQEIHYEKIQVLLDPRIDSTLIKPEMQLTVISIEGITLLENGNIDAIKPSRDITGALVHWIVKING